MKLNANLAILTSIASLLIVAPIAAQQQEESSEWGISLLDDCSDDGLSSSIGTEWEAVTDNDRDGRSKIDVDGQGGTLSVSGSLQRGRLFGGPGTAGIFLPLDESLSEYDINSWDGIRLRIRRSGAPVLLRIHGNEVGNGDYFAVDVPASEEFVTYEFPFSGMGQVMSPQLSWDGTRVSGVELISWSFLAADFSFELDGIGFYRNE